MELIMPDIDDILEEYDLADDFGFTGVSDEEYQKAITDAVEEASTVTEQQTVEQYKAKLEEVERLIMPFLIKLMKAEETYIKWPPEIRQPTIKKQIEKILAITRS